MSFVAEAASIPHQKESAGLYDRLRHVHSLLATIGLEAVDVLAEEVIRRRVAWKHTLIASDGETMRYSV